jgi:hypothetical protein
MIGRPETHFGRTLLLRVTFDVEMKWMGAPSPFREPVCDDDGVGTGTRRGREGVVAVEMWWR